jgi:predicted membrane metal-binding protein
VKFVIHLSALSILGYFFLGVALFAVVIEAWALIDSLIRPTQAFVAAGKQTKPLWLIINGVATVVGLGYAFLVGTATIISFLPVAAFVAAAVYLTDVRPKVKDFRSGGGGTTHMGPYGPW